MILPINIICLIFLFSISVSVVAEESIPSSSTLNVVSGYSELSPESKSIVKSYVDKFDSCSISSRSNNTDNYPIHDWLKDKDRSDIISTIYFHDVYNVYMCSDAERRYMLKVLGNGDSQDKKVLYLMYTSLSYNLIQQPEIPPWFSEDDINNLEKLTKEYTEPFNFVKAFTKNYEDKVR